MNIAFKDLSLVKMPKTVQIYFTLEGEGLGTQRKHHAWKVYMNSYMQTMDNVSWYAGIYIRPTFKKQT